MKRFVSFLFLFYCNIFSIVETNIQPVATLTCSRYKDPTASKSYLRIQPSNRNSDNLQQLSAQNLRWHVFHQLQKTSQFQNSIDRKIEAIFAIVLNSFSGYALENLRALKNFDAELNNMNFSANSELSALFKPIHGALLATFFDIKNGKIIRQFGSKRARRALAWDIAHVCKKIYSKQDYLNRLGNFKRNGDSFFDGVIAYEKSSIVSKAFHRMKSALSLFRIDDTCAKAFHIEHNEHYQKCVTLNALCKDGRMDEAKTLHDPSDELEKQIVQEYAAHWDSIAQERLQKENEQGNAHKQVHEQRIKKLGHIASADWPQELIAHTIELSDIHNAMQSPLYLADEVRDFVNKVDSEFIAETSSKHKTLKQQNIHNRAIRIINKSVHKVNNTDSDHVRFMHLATTSHAMAVCQFNACSEIDTSCLNDIMQAGSAYLKKSLAVLDYEIKLLGGAFYGLGKKLVHDIAHPQALYNERAEVVRNVSDFAVNGLGRLSACATDVKNNPGAYAKACELMAEDVKNKLENIAHQTVMYIVTLSDKSLDEIHDEFCSLGRVIANAYNDIAKKSKEIALSAEQFFRNSDPFEVGQFVGEMVATGVEDAVILKGAGIASSFAKSATINGCNKLIKAGNASKAAQVARKIGKQTGQKFKRVVRAVEALGEDVAIAVTPEGIVIPGMEFMSQSAEKLKNAVGPISTVVCKEIQCIAKLVNEPLVNDLPLLIEKFSNYRKGFGEFSNKFIKIPYEHIFGIDFVIDKKGVLRNISGFHHDFMGVLEKSGLVEFRNKVFGKAGAYSADLIVNGKIITKTFFPSHWKREQVVEKMFEVIENYNTKGLGKLTEKGGKCALIAKTSEGIEIIMYITKKGAVKSVYPVM